MKASVATAVFMAARPSPRPRAPALTPSHIASSGSRWPAIATRIALCLPALLWSGSACSGDDALEYAVKATYLCKLPAFVTWPAALLADAFVLCVVGRRPFGTLLDRAADGQTVQQRPIVLRNYPVITTNPGCQVMFVAGSEAQSVSSVLATVRGLPVLTVTEGQTDAASTGIINFVLVDGHVRFEIDRQAATDNHLVISSKLLSLALRDRVVR